MIYNLYLKVATVLTVYGIETTILLKLLRFVFSWLQQCLPFTVLKLATIFLALNNSFFVATVLTVYGIETLESHIIQIRVIPVATVLTVYGIETHLHPLKMLCYIQLQQCLPFTVLKLSMQLYRKYKQMVLQQCLPFTVLKHYHLKW